MIHVPKPKPTDETWKKLHDRGVQEMQERLETFHPSQRSPFNESLYQGHMRYLHSIFKRKCAYCEVPLSGQPGDVEHFRPKGRVCDGNFKPIQVSDPKWGDIPHPGYYWLAYDWDNLLPSCADCNRFRWHETDVGAGKADRFVVAGEYAVRPEQLAKERALLIDPSKDDPLDHLKLEFDLPTANLLYVATTRKGEVTIDMFGLNKREDLVRQRTKAYVEAQHALQAYLDASARENNDAEIARTRKDVNDRWNGVERFTAVQHLALMTLKVRLGMRHISVSLPIPD